MKKFIVLFFVAFFSLAHSQYIKEKHYLGPSLGLSFLGTAPEIGANYEYSIDNNFSIGGIFRYFSYSEDFPFYYGKYSYTYVFLGAQGNYHFELDNKKIDPFAGLVLGFNTRSHTWDYWEGKKGVLVPRASGNSGLYLSAHGTFRYWIKPNLGLQVRLNLGNSYSAIDFGVDWKL